MKPLGTIWENHVAPSTKTAISLADSETRVRRRKRDAERRAELDHRYVERFSLPVLPDERGQ